MLIVRALYGLKSSGAAFRAFIADNMYAIGYMLSCADTDVCIIPEIKDDGFKYWEIILCYEDDIFFMIHHMDKTMDGISSTAGFISGR